MLRSPSRALGGRHCGTLVHCSPALNSMVRRRQRRESECECECCQGRARGLVVQLGSEVSLLVVGLGGSWSEAWAGIGAERLVQSSGRIGERITARQKNP